MSYLRDRYVPHLRQIAIISSKIKGASGIKTEAKANLIAQAACDKKAADIIILDMRRPSLFCDYFVIVSGTSSRHVRAISDNIEEKTRQKGIRTLHVEGYGEGSWVLLDYGDIVAHVFTQEVREFYDLERLWSDAPRRRFYDETSPPYDT